MRWAGGGAKGKEHHFWEWGFSGIWFWEGSRSVIGLKSDLSHNGSDWKKKRFQEAEIRIICKNMRMKNMIFEIRDYQGFIGKIRHNRGLK